MVPCLSKRALRRWLASVDWNFWGNLIFLLASCCYVVTAVLTHEGANWWINLLAAILFVVDSFFYILGWYVDCRMEPETHEQLQDVYVDSTTKLNFLHKDLVSPAVDDVFETEGFLARRHAALLEPLPSITERQLPI